MNRLMLALAAVAALVLGAAPLTASAQGKDKPAPISKDQRDKGMKEAPAVAKTAGLTCDVTDAIYLGTSNGKEGKSNVYEVACREGPGYVLIAQPNTVVAYDCLMAREQPSLACKLPANADPIAAFKPVVAQAGVSCTVKDARYVGSSDVNKVYEAACQEGPGYLIETGTPAKPGPTTAIPCATVASQATHCTLTTQAQIDGYIAGLASKSGQPCQVSASRYIGTNNGTGESYYEVACGQAIGFVVDTDKAGAFKATMSCAQAQPLGGCTLTDATKLAAAQNGSYSQQAKAAGFNCDVSKFRSIGLDAQHDDVVELACSNRPDGAVAAFPATAGGKTTIVDCVKAGQFGDQGACTLTQPTALYAKYTGELKAKNRASCTVSGAHYLGRNGANHDYVETACADGKPGYVLELTPSDTLASVMSCGQARASGLTCTLPTNQERH